MPGHVGAAGGRRAEHQRDGRDAGGRQLGEVPEGRAAGHEDLGLLGQVGAAGLGEVDQRQPVAQGDLMGRAAPWRSSWATTCRPCTVGSLALIRHSTPSTRPMPVTSPAPERIVGAPAGERRQLEERACRGRAAARCARGRASLPRSRWRATYFSPPPASTCVLRRAAPRRAARASRRGSRRKASDRGSIAGRRRPRSSAAHATVGAR